MKPILILYATRQGQARRIAAHVAQHLHARGRAAEVLDVLRVASPFDPRRYSAAVLVASVHLGQHEAEMVKFVRANHRQLDEIPTAFLSASLAQAAAENTSLPLEQRMQAHDEALRAVQSFRKKTQWHPLRVQAVAGALRYSDYGALVRFVMMRIAKHAGAPTDTSRDYDFTRWSELNAFVDSFLEVAFEAAPRAAVA
jgi:menaquinone-dependent protoporphyrinogen oxidase